jgi:hypothetical protein
VNTNPEIILGIGGYAGVGKDTLADLLVTRFSFTKISFADPMREMAAAMDPVVGFGEDDSPIRYTEAIEMCGYTQAKVVFPEVRQFLQRLGTEGGRKVLGEDIWVNAALSKVKDKERVVIPDMRFINEASAIKDAKGYTIRVSRKGIDAPNDHLSEHDLDGWNYDLFMTNNTFPNDMVGRLEQFFARTAPRILKVW